jgi:hypothetical protein
MSSKIEKERQALLQKLADWPLDREQRQLIEKGIASCDDIDKLREMSESLQEAEDALDAVFDHLDEMEAGE